MRAYNELLHDDETVAGEYRGAHRLYVAFRHELAVRLGAHHLPPGELCVGLTAVVESAGGRHSYWSLRHPAGQPDFHHREGFALALRVPTP